MSRWIETGKDERGRFYLETLKDPDGCKWLTNEVCCNDKCGMCCDFPFEEDCTAERCPYFEREAQEDIYRLMEGVKTYDGQGEGHQKAGRTA